MFRLAHISDPHLAPLPRPRLSQLLSKRITGLLSWSYKRNAIHRTDVLDTLVEDMRRQQPDHLVVTGDLVNISLPAEFEQSAEWLRRLGPPEDVTVVPGNHDAYVPVSWDRSWRHWADYMVDERDGVSRPAQSFDDFPFVRVRDKVALVGTSSGLPTMPFLATGKLGAAQLKRLEDRLRTLGERGLFRVVLVHHPPLRGQTKWRKCLTDSADFVAAVTRAGAELVLHGHMHHYQAVTIDPDGRAIPVFGVTSASGIDPSKGPDHQAAYHVYEIRESGNGWEVRMTARSLDETTGSLQAADERLLTLPAN